MQVTEKKTRIYRVTNNNGMERLVEASSQAQAERHVALPIKASIATQVQLVNLVRSGVEIERAGGIVQPTFPSNDAE